MRSILLGYIKGSIIKSYRVTFCFFQNSTMSSIKNTSSRLKRPIDEISPTKNSFKSDVCNYFDRYTISQNTPDANLLPESIRIYFVLYVKQLQSIDRMLDVTRQQLELFVSANILYKFNTVTETIRNCLKTFTDELIDQVGHNGVKDASIISSSSSCSSKEPKKVKLSEKSSEETTKDITTNDAGSNDDFISMDFELQMEKAAEECERECSSAKTEIDNADSCPNSCKNQTIVRDGENIEVTLLPDHDILEHFLDYNAPAQLFFTYAKQFPNSSPKNFDTSRALSEIVNIPVSNIAPKQKRKRKGKKSPQNRVDNKKNKYSNQIYYTTEGRKVLPKEFEDYHCSCECYKKVPVEQRRELFDRYWALGDYMNQTVFIGSLVKQKPVARRRPRIKGNGSVRRQFTRDYMLLNQKVCQTLFVRTFGITPTRVHTVMEKMYQTFDLRDGRGGYRRKTVSKSTEPAKSTKPKSTKSITFFQNDHDGYVKVYVDGCCFNNGKPNAKAGYGVWFSDNCPYNLSEAVHGVATNNNAEIQAATAAFRIAKNQRFERLRIYSDSEFFINCMSNWIHNWRINGWKTRKNQPVRNKESLVECDKMLRSWGGRVDYTHVTGHTGVHGNEQADRLAKEGATKFQ